MPRRYFNWKLAIVLLLSLIVLGVTAVGLRQWQKSNSAERALVLGNQAYSEPNWAEAANYLGRYLQVVQDDVPILLKYAEAQMNIRPLRTNNIQQAVNSYRVVLRIESSNLEAAKQLTEIYLMTGMPGEAELIAERQLKTTPDPDLQRMFALALARQRKFNEAEVQLKDICTKHPEQILAYEVLGRLIEQSPENFSDTPLFWFDEALKNNPNSALAYLARAGFYSRSSDRNRALADINKAENQDLSETSVRLRLAVELINVNLPDRAEQHLEEIQKVDPTYQSLWQVWAGLVLQSGSQEKMLMIARRGLEELYAQPWDFMPMAAELFIRAGQFDLAAEYISKLSRKDIDPARVAFLNGLLAAQKENFFEAVKYWRQSEELGNQTTQLRLSLASALSNLGDTQSALRQLRTLIDETPDSFDGRLLLAKLLAQTANWVEAEEHAARAAELDPENSEAYTILLQARMQLSGLESSGQNAQILKNVEEQLAILEKTAPESIETELLRLQVEMQRGNFTAAGQMINRLKNKYPSNVRIVLAEAELLAAQQNSDEAITKLYEAVDQFPQAVGPVRYLAILLYRQDDKQRCETIVKDALSRIEHPVNQRELGLLLAQFYTRWNQTDNAYFHLDELAQKLPNDIPVKRRLLLCQQVLENPVRAQQLVDQIKSLEGEDGWQWRYEQARIWFIAQDFKDRYPQIVSILQENLLANPSDQISRMLLARAYEKAGELQLAISTYQEALSRSPDDLRIKTSTVAALYKANKFNEAEELLSRASQAELLDPQLQQLQLKSYLRRGQLDSASDVLQDLLNNDPNNKSIWLSLALLKMQQNQLDESEEMLTVLKAQEPNSLPITAAQIQLYLRQDKKEDVLRICDETVKNLNSAAAYILRSRTYYTLGQTDNAQQDLQQAINIEPDSVEVWIARSDLYRSLGRIEQSIDDIQHALTISPNDVGVQKRAISLFLTSGQPDRIRTSSKLVEEALKLNPDDIELQLFKASSLLAEGTAPAIESGKIILQQITQSRPEVSEAWQMLGDLMLRQGQPGMAVDMAMRGLTYNPGDNQLMFLKARAEAVRSSVLAIPTLKELCVLYPNDITAAMYLANIYLSSSESQKAVSLLREQLTACDLSSRRAFSIALAFVLYKAGNKAEAQEQFNSLLESEPNDPGPILAQARLLIHDKLWGELKTKAVYWYQGHPQDSDTPVAIARELLAADNSEAKETCEDILRVVLENDPDNIGAMSNLAIVLQLTGRATESVALYQQIIALEPNNIFAINNLAWIMSEEQDQHQQALQLAQRGLEIQPQYVDLIDTRGVIYYRMDEFDKAVNDLTRAVELYPESSPQGVASRFHLARAFAELGQKSEAFEHLDQALEMYNRIGGLSTAELNEAKLLLRNLQEDN